MPLSFTFRVIRPVPRLGVIPGDVIVVRPGTAEPIVLCRPLGDNFGMVLGAEVEGALVNVTPDAPTDALREAVGLEGPGPASRPPRRPPSAPYLRLAD